MRIGIIGLGKLGSKVLEHTQENSSGDTLTVTSIYSKHSKLKNATQSLDEFLSKIDVIVDCSVDEFDLRAPKINKPIIIATTQEITQYPLNTPILIFPNASSWHILHNAIVNLSKHGRYHFTIQDIHGAHKKDHISGSIRKLISELNTNDLQVFSTRALDIKGSYMITAFNEHETIKIEHQVHDRSTYAKGLINAAQWIIKQSTGIYYAQDYFSHLV